MVCWLLKIVINSKDIPNDMAKTIHVQLAPAIPGLRFRGLDAPADYTNMNAIFKACSVEDGFDYSETVEDIAKYYANLTNCDPRKDILFAEVEGKAIGYSRVWFILREEPAGYIYQYFVSLVPEWRGKGIAEAMVDWCDSRVREISGGHSGGLKKEILIYLMDIEKEQAAILQSRGYNIVRYGYTMVRPNLDNIPDIPLPQGIEVRPVEPEHYRKIWDADFLASQDGWLKVKQEEQWYRNWLDGRWFQPELWQVAWDGDRVAGAVQNWIDCEENKTYGRKRGWTENIHVGREWRGRGIAQALIARSFQVLKEKGMAEAALGVDAMNPTGALHLYKKMGFLEDKTFHTYSKEL
jgi:GNAT superfamily N-acetyltransferase